jgi:hypothetical protein
LYPEKEKTALGATNTEDGKANESIPSLSEFEAKVKQAQANAGIFPAPDPKVAKSLDLRTEIFMLNEVSEILEDHFCMDATDKFSVLSRLISACEDVNGI